MAQGNIIASLQQLSTQQGKSIPASVILQNPQLAATMSKLVAPNNRGTQRIKDSENTAGLLNTGVSQISKTIMARVEDNDNILRLFPDIKLAMQIVISSILSPKDMLKSELIYSTKTNRFPATLVTKLTKVIREALDVEYKLSEELPEILEQALFMAGSAPKAILPEAAVDAMINQKHAMVAESLISSELFIDRDMTRLAPMGLLGNSAPQKDKAFTRTSVFENAATLASPNSAYSGKPTVPPADVLSKITDEIIDVSKVAACLESWLEISDNYHFLKMPKLLTKASEQTVTRLVGSKLKKRAMKFATEAMQQMTTGQLETMLYKGSNRDYKPFMAAPSRLNLHRKSVGRPLVMNLPAESAIPVHVPGDVANHIGYFIPVDVDGNPITVNSTSYDAGQGLDSMLASDKNNSSLSGLLTEKARRNLTNDGIAPSIDRAAELYAEILERDLMERLLKGAYGKKVQISRNNEIYRIMLARSLQAQFTRLIYIPAEYVTYFAFTYHRNGVGKSYLDDLSNITSLRAMVLFSDVMSKVKSSIAVTSVNVALDARDNDPLRTIELAKHFVTRARQQYFPHGLNRVVDLTDWIQRAGIEITFEGHPQLPSTKFNFESKNLPHVLPDDTLDEKFRHQTYMHFGLSPETVDNAAKSDFATTIQQNSVLFAQRIYMLSNIFSVKLTDYATKIVSNDEIILSALAEVLRESRGELEAILDDEEKELFTKDEEGFLCYILDEFLEVLKIDLPKPDETRNANESKAFSDYDQMVDQALKYVFSEEMLGAEYAGKSAELIASISKAWKAEIMRQYMANNNYLPELFKITQRDEEGKPAVDMQAVLKNYTQGVMVNVADFLKSIQATRLASDKDLKKLEEQGAISDPVGGGSFGGDTGSSDFGSDFGDSGAGDAFENPFGDGTGDGSGSGAGDNEPPPEGSDPFSEVKA